MAKIVSDNAGEILVHLTADEIKHIAESLDELAASLSDEDCQRFVIYQNIICAMAFVNRCITAKEIKGLSDDEAIEIVGREQARLVKSLIKSVTLEEK